MIVSVLEARYVGDYKLWLRFNTGEEGIVDLSDVIRRYPAARPLQDKAVFAAFKLDEWPTVTWPCGFDMAPEVLYEKATGKSLDWRGDSVSSAAGKKL